MTIRKISLTTSLGLFIVLAGLAGARAVGTEDIYISASGSGTAGGVSFADEDIVLCDRFGGAPETCSWSMFFDGSAEGVSRQSDLTAFHVEDEDNILMSFKTPKKVGGLKKVDDSDIVHFDRTAANPNSAFTFYFDGSDVGLSTDDESIDAMGFDETGRLVISTDGDYSVPKTGGGTLSGVDADLIVFNGSTGPSTSGDFELYFDGASAGFNTPQEDIWGVWIDTNTDEVYLTTRGNFSVGSLSGVGTDIFVCEPAGFDPIPSCTTVSSFFIANDENYSDKIIDGLYIFNNTPPVAQDDLFTMLEDGVLNGNVLDDNGNGIDDDIDGDPLTVNTTPISGPSNGTLALLADGNFTYTPFADFNGTDMFEYEIDDGNGGTDIGLVTITVTAVNDVPSFTKGADQLILEDAGAQNVPGWATGISAGPPDEAGQALTFNVVGNTNAGMFVAGPSIDSTGMLTYTIAADASGSANISIELMDDGGTANGGVDTSAPQTFTINVTAVNDAPSFTKGADETVLEDAGAQTVVGWATGISAGPPDEAGQTLTFNVVGNTNPAMFSAGPAIDSTGTLTYTAAADANGTADITIELMDDGGTANGGMDTSAPQTFTINVTAVNDVPSFTKGADETVLENAGAQSVPGWATGISAGPTDEAGQTLTFNVTGNTNAGLFISGPSIDSTGNLSYTTATDANGSADITIELMDDGGTANGGVDTSATQMFSINVTAVNNAPSFTKGADESVLEDAGAQTTVGWATGISAGPPDEAGQTLTFNVTGNTNAAMFSAGPSIDATGTLTYTPAADANGTADITIELMDDGGTSDGGDDTSDPQTFTINVTAVNDVPSFTKGANQSSLEDAGAQNIAGWATGISAGPADEAGQVLTFNVTNNTNAAMFTAGPSIASNGDLTYTTVADAHGTADVTIELMDDGGTTDGGVDTSATQTFTINVTAVNDAPSFTKGADEAVLEDAGAQTVPGWATGISAGPPDEAGQTLTFNVTGNTNAAMFSAGPSIDSAGTLTYTPAADANGTADITIVLMDNGGTTNGGADTSAPQTFTINVMEVNDVPSFIKGSDQTVQHDAGAQTVVGWATGISVGPANESGQVPSFNITNNTDASLFAAVPAVSSVGTLTYTPQLNASGTATITLNVMDDGGTANGGIDTSATQSFDITVNTVVAPTANNDTFSSLGNVGIDFSAVSGVLFADNGSGADDDGGGTLVVSQVQSSAANVNVATATSMSGSVTANADGSFSYVPAAGFEGADTFTYTAMNVAGSSQATVTINVSDVIWFVDNTAGAGDGRLNTPFNTLAAFEAVNGNGGANDPASGDGIFIYTGVGSYTGGVTLENDQQLIGQGTPGTTLADVLGLIEPTNSNTLPSINGTRPVFGGASGTAVVLASDNTVSGLDATMTGSAQGIVGNSLGTATAISDVSITTNTGTALSLSNGNAIVDLDSVTSTGAGANSAIILSNTGLDEIAVNGGTISNKTVDAITLNDTDGQVVLSNMIIEDIGVSSDTTDPLNTRSGRDGIHGQVVSGGLMLDGVTIRRISDNCVNGSIFANGVSATTWDGLEIIDSTIENCNRYDVADKGDSQDEGAVRIAGITGTVLIDNSTLQFAAELIDFFTHTSGDLDMTVQDSTFNRSIKEFSSGATVNTGLHGIDVTFKGSTDGVIRIGDPAESDPSLGNTFTDNAVGSIRIAQDTGTTGDVAVVISQNTFEVIDHLTSQQLPGNFVFNIPQGGVLLWAQGGTFEGIVSNNTFDQVMHASGGLGQLTLIGDTDSDSEFIVEGNTFDLPWDAPVRILADNNTSMAVRFGGPLAGEPNTYIDGLLPGNLADDLGNGCSPGYISPYTPWHLNVRNDGELDLTIQDETLPQHDDGSSPCFPSGSGFVNSFDASISSGVSETSTLNLGITGSASPDGYKLAQSGGSGTGVFNLYATAGCAGPPTAQAILDANSNTGGNGTYLVNGDATSPPVVATVGTINCTTTAPTLPSITIP